LHVSYSGTDGNCVRYNCRSAHLNHGTRPCIAFGGLWVGAAVSSEVLRHLGPLGVIAALEAIAMREGESAGTRRQAELAFTQARYEADLARRQYDAVDPANRLVAAESRTALERSTGGSPAPGGAACDDNGQSPQQVERRGEGSAVPVKIVMTLLVRDEADIIRQNIAYHRARGVDHFVVTDNLSIDGTTDILIELEREGLIDLIHERDDTYAQAKWVTRMARRAAMLHGADWVINCDADEFWWPLTPSLKDPCAAAASDVFALEVQRTNFVPPIAEHAVPLRSMTVRCAVSKNPLGRPLPPRSCIVRTPK
jgi:hypothetical protein